MNFKHLLISVCLLAAGRDPVSAEETTLIMSDTLETASVTADRGIMISRTDTLHLSMTDDVIDVLMSSPGIQVTDMGGPAGLKTAGLRGFGTAHTAIYLDGIRINNIQSGQGDLGMTGAEDLESITVDYMQNSISFNTAAPVFSEGRKFGGKVTVAAGSFGTWEPHLKLDFRTSERTALSINAGAVASKGNFTCPDGSKRQNNDIARYRAGADMYGTMKGGRWHVKAGCHSSDRGTPGPISFPSEDRQKDINAFIQGTAEKEFGNIYTLIAGIKGGYDLLEYTSQWGDSSYGQTEIQLNTSHLFRVNRWCGISVTAAGTWDRLASASYTDDDMSRLAGRVNAAASFRLKRLKAEITAGYDMASDNGKLRHAFTPGAGIRFDMTDNLHISAYGKRAYRIPTFNELYYIGYGNPELKCEDAWISDLGIGWRLNGKENWTAEVKADGFCNFLMNKITSAPSEEDPAVWMPYNIGRTLSLGADICASMRYRSKKWSCGFSTCYTFLHSTDKTPGSSTYGTQTPYTAKHSLTLSGSAEYEGFVLDMRWNLREGRCDTYGSIPAWNTLDASLEKSFRLGRKTSARLTAGIKAANLADTRYELSSGYPMPGRSFRCILKMEF